MPYKQKVGGSIPPAPIHFLKRRIILKIEQKNFEKYKTNGVFIFPAYSEFDEGCSFGKRCSTDSIIWGYMYMPKNLKAKKVLPSASLRKHYKDRLSRFDFVFDDDDCYGEIQDKINKLTPAQKKEIRDWDGWLPVERWTLKTWL